MLSFATTLFRTFAVRGTNNDQFKELILSFVPNPEQRLSPTMTRTKLQLTARPVLSGTSMNAVEREGFS
jgi:hypothetical protein